VIVASGIAMQFGAKPLFSDVSVKFGGGNRYGLIGANGCGKSTFMKILGGELEPSAGSIAIDANERVGRLRQDQFAYENERVLDVVLMGHILHDWDLPTKKMLIKKAFDAVPNGGALIVYEAIIDDDRSKNAFGLMMSLNMLIETPGGFDYTGADCSGWMREAGFSRTRVEPLVGPDSMVIGIK